MPRYGVATYGRGNKSKDIGAQMEFDLAMHAATMNKSSQDCSERTGKSEQKSRRREEPLKTSKRRKVVPLLEDDLFGFTENDSDTVPTRSNKLLSQKSSKESKSKTTFESSTDGTDKSTDDEAYCSSQEPNSFSKESGGDEEEKPTQRQSPFKHFLKNNVVSLSPKKNKKLDRRFSALPTNVGTSDEDFSDSNTDTQSSAAQMSSWSESQSPIPSKLRVNREEKRLFTVVRNVKHKHACLEDGETQQFFDDVDFALDGLRKDLSLAARCSSALDLASQCSTPSFRANLRAHGFISKIFDLLHDAPSNKTLAFCTSFVFYMITRDRLNVDFDTAILDLLLKLLHVNEISQKSKIEKKNVHEEMLKKARQILTRLPEAFTCYLDMENLSSVSLARDSLLSLTSQRSGEWFKEEMRTLGGLDYIVNISVNKLFVQQVVTALLTVREQTREETMDHGHRIRIDQKSTCTVTRNLTLKPKRKQRILVLTSVENIRDNIEELLQNEKGIENIERCLKLIENVTFQNRENQLYLVSYKKSSLIVALTRLMKVCTRGIIEDQLAIQCLFFKTVLDCVKSILRVFLNLTHDNDGESETIGQQDGLISALLLCVLQVPQFVAADDQFDILVLALGLLINLVEHSKQNIASLIILSTPLSYENRQDCKQCKRNEKVPAIEALVHLFQIRQEAARNNENMTCDVSNDSGDELKPTQDGLGWVCGDDIDISREEDDIQEGEKLKKEVDTCEKKDEKPPTERSLEDEIGDALQKAGKHMEDSMVASYVALLLGCIAQDNKANQNLIRQLLPENNFTVLINTLKTFLGFMRLTSGTTGQAIERIIDVLKAC